MVGAVRDESVLADQDVVEEEELLAVYRGERVTAHHDVPGETEVLLDVLAHVRVIPVNAGVGKSNAIVERLAWLHGLLAHVRHAVEAMVEPDAVPVYRRRLIDRIGESNEHLGILRYPQQRARNLAVERVHRVLAPVNSTPNHTGRELERVAGVEAQDLTPPRRWGR